MITKLDAVQYNRKLREIVGSKELWELCSSLFANELSSREMLDHLLYHMLLTGVPSRFQSAHLGAFPSEQQRDVFAALSQNSGLFIHGKRGRGKTMLACAVLRELKSQVAHDLLKQCWQNAAQDGYVEPPTRAQVDRYVGTCFSEALMRGPSMLFKNTAELMDDIKRCFDAGAETNKQDLVDKYAQVDVLVLDDLGMEKPSAFVRETFDMIINRRWSEEKMCVFTSNFDLVKLETHYEDEGRISSRVAGMCAVVEMVGSDQRLRNQEG